MIEHAVTVPLHIMRDRPFIDVNFVLNEFQMRTARCWLDTGGGAVIITEQLAQSLGVAYKRNRPELVPARLPPLYLGEMMLDLTAVPTFVALDQCTIHGEEGVEAFCGGALLGKYRLIFDYPRHQFTLTSPDHIHHSSGVPLPLSIQPENKFPRVEVQIGGEVYGMLLDTGAATTMVSQAVIERWISQDAGLLKGIAASHPVEEMKSEMTVCISQLNWGPYLLEDVYAISRPWGVFEQSLSQMMSGPVIGALAGNVLKQFRCEIDYAESALYLQRSGPQP